jgi:DNA polymerase III subunit epsilon
MECPACSVRPPGTACVRKIDRTRHLMRVYSALETLRVPRWPHAGPVGIRERSDIHVIEDWTFLGTAQSESTLYEILESRPRGFDQRVYRLLNRTLRRLTPDNIIDLASYRSTHGPPVHGRATLLG